MIDSIMSDFIHPSGPGASVLVMIDDSIVFNKAYGLADIQTGQAVTAATNFRLASVTKQFTAMGILMLSEKGRLSLQDSLHKYFPGIPGYARNVRIIELLTHISGLPDYEDLIPETLQRQVLDHDCLDLLHRAEALYFPSGTRYRYSNTGYALLALVIEKVTEKKFSSFLRDDIFKPLGMTTTIAREDAGPPVSERAYGHSRTATGWMQTDQSQTSAVLGDGGIYSNPTELSVWIRSLWSYKLIRKELQQQAWSKMVLKDGSRINYGFGWHLDGPGLVGYPNHDGSTKGFRNHILVYPDRRMMVVVLTNRDEGAPRKLAEEIAALYR